MLINTYKNSGVPEEVFIYAHPDIDQYSKLYFLGDKHATTTFHEGKIISLNRLDGVIEGLEAKDAISYLSLPYSSQRDLLKRALSTKLISSGLARRSNSKFYFPIGSGLEPKSINGMFINYAVASSLYQIQGSTHLVIDPCRIVTKDGVSFDTQFAKDNFSCLSQNPINYSEFVTIIKSFRSTLGDEITIDFDCGHFRFEYTASVSDREIKTTGPEPKVRFGTGKSHTFPAAGLKQNGPWDYNESVEDRPTKIRVGIIGENFTIPLLRQVHQGDKSANPYAFSGFEKVYKSRLENDHEKGRLTITEQEIASCSTTEEVGELFRSKARELSFICDTAIIELPDSAMKFTNPDLRDYLKVVFWEEKLPTQIILRQTVNRNDSLIIDNLALGIYVSAGGKPWILDEPLDNYLFIGISFGVSKDNRTLIGIVEVFDGYGMSLSINVSELKVSRHGEIEDRDKHLNQETFVKVIQNAISDYSHKYNGNHPEKVVVHKTTEFNEEESSVLEKLTDYAIEFNLIYVDSYGKGLHLLKDDYSSPPGRLIYWKYEDTKALLYTKGPDERGRTIDPFLPSPMMVELCKTSEGSTYDIDQACSDIIKLTKLNWNSVVSYEKEPVTISHSRKLVALLRAGLDLKNAPTDIRFFI